VIVKRSSVLHDIMGKLIMGKSYHVYHVNLESTIEWENKPYFTYIISAGKKLIKRSSDS